jgi:hypothetical protein
MRALHIRAVHRTWGVVLGFAVGLEGSPPGLRLEPGFAYDCHGREIPSTRVLRLLLPQPADPNTAAWFDLLLRYSGRRRPAFRWSHAGPDTPSSSEPPLAPDVRLGEEIPLCRVRVESGSAPGLSLSRRRTARALGRLLIAGGRVSASRLPEKARRDAAVLTVNTSSGRFFETPLYFAALVAEAAAQAASLDQAFAQAGKLPGPLLSVRNPRRAEFVLEIRPRNSWKLIRPRVAIEWLGVEERRGCPLGAEITSDRM